MENKNTFENKTTLVLGPRASGKTYLVNRLVKDIPYARISDCTCNNFELFNDEYNNTTKFIIRDYHNELYNYINRIDNLIVFKYNNQDYLKEIYDDFLKSRYNYDDFMNEINNLEELYEYKLYKLKD